MVESYSILDVPVFWALFTEDKKYIFASDETGNFNIFDVKLRQLLLSINLKGTNSTFFFQRRKFSACFYDKRTGIFFVNFETFIKN